ARARRAGDLAVPRDRLSGGVRDRPRAEGLAATAAVPGHAAVLDQLSDPRLRLDRAVAAERADQPAAPRRRRDRDTIALAVQRLLGRARPRLLLSAVHDLAPLRRVVAARREPG